MANLIFMFPTVAYFCNSFRNWGAFHTPKFCNKHISLPQDAATCDSMDFQSSQSSQTKPCVHICPSQFMHYRREFNSGLFSLLHNKPSPSFSPLNFLYITWSSAESIIYKESITFFLLVSTSPWYLIYSQFTERHLNPWVPLFWKSKVKKNLCTSLSWSISHPFSFFVYFSPDFTLFCHVFTGRWIPTRDPHVLCYVWLMPIGEIIGK